jgi:hypothetical protein
MDEEIELKVYDKNEELKQLKELFEIINTLVSEQQNTLDIIEENVSSTGNKINLFEVDLVEVDLVEVDLTSIKNVKHKTNIHSKWLRLGTLGLVSLGASIPLSVLVSTKVTISSVLVIGLLYRYLQK